MNLDPLQILILRQVSEGHPGRDDGQVGVTHVAAELSVDFVFVQDAVEALYNEGYLACDQHNLKGKIKRFRLVTLTDKGREALAKFEEGATVANFLPDVTRVIEGIDIADEDKQTLLGIVKELEKNPLLKTMPLSTAMRVMSKIGAIEKAKLPSSVY